MRKSLFLTIALLSVILIPRVQKVYAATQTIDGVVSDTMCGAKHMFPGKTDAQCVQECTNGGKASYALVTSAKVYTLAGKPLTIAPFAGKHVHVEGDLKGDTITVNSIHEMQHGMKI